MIAGACGSSDDNASEQTAASTAASTTAASTTSGASPESATTAPPAPATADPGDLPEATRTVIERLAKGQNGPAWDLLVPQQQALIPRIKFLDCGDPSAAFDFNSVKVTDTYDEEVEINGTSSVVPSKAVTVDMSFTLAGQEQTQTFTIHLVDVNGEWRWNLAPEAFSRCVA